MTMLQLCHGLSAMDTKTDKRTDTGSSGAAIVPRPFGHGYLNFTNERQANQNQLQLCHGLSAMDTE